MDKTINFGDLLEHGLFALGQVLRLPVFILLWICVVLTLFYSAAYLVEAVGRRNDRKGFDLKRWLQEGPALDPYADRSVALPPSLRAMCGAIQQLHSGEALRHGGLENVVAEHEERLRHGQDALRALIKIAPSLGLIGTLIPMGTSLAAMAAGNLNAMAGQMVVAFTSTIVGLAVGTVAYGLVALRLKWVSTAVREHRYLAEAVAAEIDAR